MNAATLSLDELEAQIRGMAPAQRAELEKKVQHVLGRGWITQPGPQAAAYDSAADELLYGGAAGGGKTDLLLGLATTAHERSLLFRRQSTDLDGLWERLTNITAGRRAATNSVKKQMRLTDGRVIEGGHLEKPGSERSWMGRPHDLIGFDEGAQLDELKVEFVMRWLRSTTAGQRQRVVIATNPPIPEIRDGIMVDNGVGDWLLRWFAPWIDERYPAPAAEGELRWCFMVVEGDRLTTVWVDGPGAYDYKTHEFQPDATQEDIDAGRVIIARSRTFIRSLASDNVFLKGTGYIERLSSTPEPLRSMLMQGNFSVRGEDHPMQVIPTLWVTQAQQRWLQRKALGELERLRMLVLSGDIAQGGADTTVLAPLYETDMFGNLITQPGRLTPTGREVLSMILTTRSDKALVVLDATGGWAGSTTTLLDEHQDIQVEQFLASAASTDWTPDGVYKYANGRTKIWWNFRLALDPKSGFEIALPPSTRLMAQLTTPHWKPKGKLLYIESKDEIKTRLNGASTDEADAVLQAWEYRDQALSLRERVELSVIDRIVHGKTREKVLRERHTAVEFNDPLGDW